MQAQKMQSIARYLVCLVSLLFATPVVADSGGVTVSTNSMMLVGASAMSAGASWVTNTTYTQGTYVFANGAPYFALVAGTSTNVGSGPAGIGDVGDGTVTWRACGKRVRRGMVIMNNSTNLNGGVWISDTAPAAADKGAYVGPVNGSLLITGADCPQSALFVIMPGATGNVSTMVW